MTALTEQQTVHCTLQASASLDTPSTLRLNYQLHNLTDQAFYLFNRLWRRIDANRQFETVPNLVNVNILSDRVTVGKAVVPVPDDMEVERRYTPCLSRVAPHGHYSETLTLPLPLHPYSCYQVAWEESGDAEAKKLLELPLYLELGYVLADVQSEGYFRQVATSHGSAYYRDTAPENQFLISAGPLLLSVPISA